MTHDKPIPNSNKERKKVRLIMQTYINYYNISFDMHPLEYKAIQTMLSRRIDSIGNNTLTGKALARLIKTIDYIQETSSRDYTTRVKKLFEGAKVLKKN